MKIGWEGPVLTCPLYPILHHECSFKIKCKESLFWHLILYFKITFVASIRKINPQKENSSIEFKSCGTKIISQDKRDARTC
jgi:hypothetical protein